MDETKRQKIDQIAADILTKHEISTPIDDIDAVVRRLGGTTICDKNSQFGGKIQRDGDGFKITLPSLQNKRRKNFTVAHELGHWFLHMKNDKSSCMYRGGNSEKEYEANEFAAAFLMPVGQYEECLYNNAQNGIVDLSVVADYFNVSVEAAINRGKFLGYL